MRFPSRTKAAALASIGIVVAALFFGAAFMMKITTPAMPEAQGREEIAAAIIAACRNESYRPGCYDREIPKLMDRISMEEAFAVTRIVQEKDSSYAFCHVLGHELSAREVKKNPDDWKSVLSRCPSGICSNGCIHGGMQEKFRTETLTDAQTATLVPELQTLCEPKANWKPTGLERGTCYHAVGHLAMYMTDGDIKKSVALCDGIVAKGPGRDFMHVCLDGAFMQMFQPLEPEDFALVKGKQPTRETLTAFCNKFAGEAKGSCVSEAWPLFAEEVKKPQGLAAFCGREEAAERDRCFNGMFYVLTVQFQFDTDALQQFCSGLPTPRAGQCAAGVASRLIETDYRNIEKAVRFCSDSSRYDPMEQCFRQAASFAGFTFHPGSRELLELCNNLPERWRRACAPPSS